jgi:hypothetical protein
MLPPDDEISHVVQSVLLLWKALTIQSVGAYLEYHHYLDDHSERLPHGTFTFMVFIA